VPYTSRNAGPLTAEERDVQAALRSYAGSGAGTDWVPTAVLYRAYRLWFAQQNRPSFDPLGPARLTPRQFGAALRRVFPLIRRVRRREAKRLRWGYAGLSGPLSLRSEWQGQRQPTRYRHGWKPWTPNTERPVTEAVPS
jgi:hypothetical protein